jgi:hypothetical protein
MLIKRARLLADVGEQGMNKKTRAGLEGVREECRQLSAGAALAAVEAALAVTS